MLGHSDFEAQNLRRHDGHVWVVRDWDSLAWLPEGGTGGSGEWVFPETGPATLPPIEDEWARRLC